jgi:hypothetical protein
MIKEEREGCMKQRRITLADGRYLIFYTFDDEAATQTSSAIQGVRNVEHEPERQPQDEEGKERRV